MTWVGYGGFLVIAVLLCVSPGPDTLVVLKNTLGGGRRGGVLAAAGVLAGNLTMGTVVALGVGVLIARSHPVFVSLHWLGAAYLAYLGVQALRAARRGDYSALAAAQGQARSGVRRALEGLLSNVTNPKVLVVYLSVLPQFLTPATSVLQALLLAWTIGLLGVLWQGLLVLLVDRAKRWLSRARVRRGLDAVFGTALLGFGAALLLDS